MLPTRIDVTSFVQKQLPELQLQIPSLQYVTELYLYYDLGI